MPVSAFLRKGRCSLLWAGRDCGTFVPPQGVGFGVGQATPSCRLWDPLPSPRCSVAVPRAAGKPPVLKSGLARPVHPPVNGWRPHWTHSCDQHRGFLHCARPQCNQLVKCWVASLTEQVFRIVASQFWKNPRGSNGWGVSISPPTTRFSFGDSHSGLGRGCLFLCGACP